MSQRITLLQNKLLPSILNFCRVSHIATSSGVENGQEDAFFGFLSGAHVLDTEASNFSAFYDLSLPNAVIL